jgi:hypothetical protein
MGVGLGLGIGGVYISTSHTHIPVNECRKIGGVTERWVAQNRDSTQIARNRNRILSAKVISAVIGEQECRR